jgi:hypothetical protein
MRTLFATCLLAAAPLLCASHVALAATDEPTSVKGRVLEVNDAGSYTYLRLKTQNGETWAAITRAPVKKGSDITLEKAMVMHDFESKAMQRTFDRIVFGSLAATSSSSSGAKMDMNTAHQGLTQSGTAPDERIAKATGTHAKTVAEIFAQSTALKDKPVLIRGKVVKYNAGIMGKNWVHLRDGSGSAAAGTNDLLVTTASTAKVSDVVTVKGVVRLNKDFGAGYVYAVLVEDATLQR